jgi:hypothetical protein
MITDLDKFTEELLAVHSAKSSFYTARSALRPWIEISKPLVKKMFRNGKLEDVEITPDFIRSQWIKYVAYAKANYSEDQYIIGLDKFIRDWDSYLVKEWEESGPDINKLYKNWTSEDPEV